ncbi:glycoside hydrolase family 9 protein, partial [Streptosporangium vulgare]|uniref:glycoside hydrolase family 9 protein n=1 Tax=Streptosporangium vulgare TaxID=46190 RepID=UPI003CD09C4A
MLYGQVGNTEARNHAWWGPGRGDCRWSGPRTRSTLLRGVGPGRETAAAMAASSIVFRPTNPTYADTLVTHAKQLYTFADTVRKKYSDCITDASGYYQSWSGYNDDAGLGRDLAAPGHPGRLLPGQGRVVPTTTSAPS